MPCTLAANGNTVTILRSPLNQPLLRFGINAVSKVPILERFLNLSDDLVGERHLK